MEDRPETIEELHLDHFVTEEGDLIPPTDRNAVDHIWPTQSIPYVISPEISSRTPDIQRATMMISSKTCLTFHQRTSEIDYLHFQDSLGCASYVGCIGGDQPVFIGSVCGAEKNFVKRPGNTLNVSYDTDSIMHYGSQYFSSNGEPTIISNHRSKNMGQRVKLTSKDIKRIRLLYGCDS
ncbi:hypothetical protein WMY93_020624 [Mugilogobius chulae]|uniref:Peptidase M12A domain-containing protein n=1 Tax=Mugilogobius chulae TaxID=88201 RepID=A0AAW0NJJ5_9GOBI